MADRTGRRRTLRGLTMVELLALLLVLSVLMAVALPLYNSAMADSYRKACRDNMQVIANSEREFKLQSATHVYSTSLSALNAVGPCPATCPSGGTYTVTATSGSTFTITCSASGHGSYTVNGSVY